MEDKQPTAGDLTDDATEVEDVSAAEDVAETAEVVAAEEVTETAAAPVKEPSKAREWLSRRKTVLAIGVSTALFVGAGTFAGAVVQPYLADQALNQTKLEIARTAASAITTLWTYTPDDMEKLPDRSARYLSGGFEDQYRKYVDAIVPQNKQAKVTNSTQVVGAAVESLRGSEATAVVFTNSTATSPLTKEIPSIKYLSYRLELKRQGGRWLVTKMTTVTSLDLTPKL